MERDLYSLVQESRPTEETFKHFAETDKVEWRPIASNPFAIRRLEGPITLVGVDESLKTLKQDIYENIRFGEEPSSRSFLPPPSSESSETLAYGRKLERQDLGLNSRPAFPLPDSDHEIQGLYHRDPVGRFLRDQGSKRF